MGTLTDIVVGAAVLAGTFYAGYKYAEYKDYSRHYATNERNVVDIIDDALCSKHKYYSDCYENCIDISTFESEEGRYDFADYFSGKYSSVIQQELVTSMFAEMNQITQIRAMRDMKEIMNEQF